MLAQGVEVPRTDQEDAPMGHLPIKTIDKKLAHQSPLGMATAKKNVKMMTAALVRRCSLVSAQPHGARLIRAPPAGEVRALPAGVASDDCEAEADARRGARQAREYDGGEVPQGTSRALRAQRRAGGARPTAGAVGRRFSEVMK